MMLAELLATDGVEQHFELRSRVGFLALHGGLEAMTYEIARAAAERAGASLYAVVQPDQLTWHVPSHRFDPGESEALAGFCAHVHTAISVHGYGGIRDHPNRWLTIAVGGSGRDAAAEVASAIRVHLGDYDVLDDIESIPRQYRGLDPRNPVNRVQGPGVQIELPPRVRGTSPFWAEHDFHAEPLVPHTRSLIDAMVEAARRLDLARDLGQT